MSNFDALKAATVNPARALAVDTGTIEAGKLADLIVVDGDPLARMADLHKIKKVVANGRLYELNQLLNAAGVSKTSTQR
jgi:imidazolonepropionase-like amidohydrolase